MRQVVQPLSGGDVRVLNVPRPVIGPTEVLVRTRASLISSGTERALTSLAQSSLLSKARARPDMVRQVVERARSDGVRETIDLVRNRMAGDLPFGYSAAGEVVEVGSAVAGLRPGQLVATGGAGHAEYQAVPGLLCAPVPDGVPAEHAAFATLGSVALHGFRLAELGPGSDIAVIGLGLVGQLAARLALAAGCRVAGIDVAAGPVERAAAHGVLAVVDDGGEGAAQVVRAWADGNGADAVLVTAADKTSAIMQRVPMLCRDRAVVVVIGDVGMELSRRDLYAKELTVRVARSYGPGRYERSYEDWGVDYPPGYVRWTEGRNQRAVLELLASGRLKVNDLITHRYPIAEADRAYELIERRAEPYVGIVLDYPAEPRHEEPINLAPGRTRVVADRLGVGVVGAGAFATSVLMPALSAAGFERFVAIASASGLTARGVGERKGFEKAVPGAEAVIDDPDVGVVVVATAHDSHAELAVQALAAGKAVWCEKPLALTMEELDAVEAAARGSGGVLFAGFNRRFSPTVRLVREHVAAGAGPLVITYRVNAGPIPDGHWYEDRRQGGRLLGEICHFVDTCAAIAGDIVDAHAFGAGDGELLLSDDFVVSLRHADGSLSTISYAAHGHRSTRKERIEVLGRDRAAVIDDFREVVLDGKRHRLKGQDKGHRAAVDAFYEAVRAGGPSPSFGVDSTRAVLRAAAALSLTTAARP